MKWRKGPRPWPIHVFAICLVIGGLYSLSRDIIAPDYAASKLETMVWGVDWTRDKVIVFSSAMFTIVLLPVVAIWTFASKVARILVTVMAVPAVLHLYSTAEMALRFAWEFDPFSFAFGILRLAAIALLYAPASQHWFARRREVDAETFA